MKVGDKVIFGIYADEPIEWQVLEATGSKCTMISTRGLDAVKFDDDSNEWETSYIRRWLNDTFYNTAFTKVEKSDIVEGTSGDKVYLLSTEEAEKYFQNRNDRICYVTPYAEHRGAFTTLEGACWWWLRSKGVGYYVAAFVDRAGDFDSIGNYVYDADACVRPVIVIDLSKYEESVDNS